MLNKFTVIEIFKRFQQKNPNPTTELNYKNNFELLIAVVLSAQATDVMVNKVTERLFSIANTPEKILKLGEQNLLEYIKSIGLFRVKARNIIKICIILINKFKSKIPNTRENLESLPGVGRKTANVVLNTAFKQPTIAVDRHIFRVANRIGLVIADTVLATEMQLLKIIPKKFILNAHHWLILHGRYICTARKPKCSSCFINDLCKFVSLSAI
jgi:endonuclease III